MAREIEVLKHEAYEARAAYSRGLINRAAAKKAVQSYIDAVNAKAAAIAMKYGQRPKKVSAAAFMR